MIHVLDFIIRWTLYPVVFAIFLAIDYLFNLIFWFELPKIDIQRQFERDSRLEGFSLGDFAYVMSWIFLGMALVWWLFSKLYNI